MSKYVVDANVMLLPGQRLQDIPVEQLHCAKKCTEFLEDFMNEQDSRLVLDARGKILKEYRDIFNFRNESNVATAFCTWALTEMPRFVEDFVSLNETSKDEFDSYPSSEQLRNFDPPDRKYIAVSYNHPDKPPIVEASDSKWWGIREELKDAGITVQFIDEEYIEQIYAKKFRQK